MMYSPESSNLQSVAAMPAFTSTAWDFANSPQQIESLQVRAPLAGCHVGQHERDL